MAWRISGEEERTGRRRVGVRMSIRETVGAECVDPREGMFWMRLRR